MIKLKKLIIVGLGETAELAYHYFMNDSEYEVVAFAADKEYVESDSFLNLPVYDISELHNIFEVDNFFVFVAVSSSKLNRVRKDLYLRVKRMGYQFASYISSEAYVGYGTKIGENCFIMEHNVVQPFVTIGDDVVLWSGNHIGHRTIVHDHCFISSHVVISGFCEIGAHCFLGVNTSVADNVKIGEDCLVGIGCVIAKDVAPNSIMKMPYAQKQIITAKQFYGIE